MKVDFDRFEADSSSDEDPRFAKKKKAASVKGKLSYWISSYDTVLITNVKLYHQMSYKLSSFW